MATDNAEPLVTKEMVGMMVVFGADVVLLIGVLWIVGVVPGPVALGVTAVVVAAFALWVGWRWRDRRANGEGDTTDEPEADPVETLKRRYAAGELTEAEFERRLDDVLDVPERADDVEPADSVEESVESTGTDAGRTERESASRDERRERSE